MGSQKVNIDDMHGKIRSPLINIATVLIRSSDGQGTFCFIHDLDHRWKNWVQINLFLGNSVYYDGWVMAKEQNK